MVRGWCVLALDSSPFPFIHQGRRANVQGAERDLMHVSRSGGRSPVILSRPAWSEPLSTPSSLLTPLPHCLWAPSVLLSPPASSAGRSSSSSGMCQEARWFRLLGRCTSLFYIPSRNALHWSPSEHVLQLGAFYSK